MKAKAMSMTKKDFNAIATQIRQAYLCEYGNPTVAQSLRDLAHGLSWYFKSANPGFDESRFTEACFLVGDRETTDLAPQSNATKKG